MAEQMKPSGIDWIGDIPESWDVVRIKDIGTYRNGLTYAPEDIAEDDNGTLVLRSSNIQNGKISYDDNVYVKCSVSPELMVKKGDIIICSRNGSRELIGKNAIIENSGLPCSFGAFMMVYRCSCPRYMYYILNSEVFSYYLGTFLTSTINQLTGNNFGNMKIVFCKDRNEQKRIVDFLDKECAQIDSIAVDLEKQIELLQQYKKSLITETVTKGLDKSVPMKDSGVEWIGEIPEHWNVLRVKDISKLQTGTTPPGNEGVNFDNDGIQWFTPADFNDGSIKLGLAEKSIDFDTIHRENIKAYPAYTVLFVGIASIGKIGFSPNTCYSNQQITGIKPNNNKNGKYIAYSLLAGMDSIKDNALYTTVPIVNNAYLGNIKISFPPTNEQESITKYLDYATSSVDEIIGKKLEQLSTIQQHKKSLIYEYVTGKKRVKEVQ